jgi:flagellar biosynthesis protein FliR
MNELLTRLAHDDLAAFILVLARIGPLFLLAPLFSAKAIPARVRGIVAVAIAIGLTPMALHGQTVPSDVLAVGALVIKEILVGTAFAFSLGVLFAAVQAAGSLLDTLVGFSFGSLLDPVTGNQASVLAQVYALVGLAVFIAIGGDAWVLQGLARTYALVPMTGTPQLSSLVGGAEHAFTSIFASTLEIAAPVVLALIITDAAFGVVSRVVPQLNVFAVGFPVKVAVGLLVIGASLPFVSGWVSGQLELSVTQALQTLKVA